VFIKQIRSQIFVILIVFGFQVGTVRLPFIDVLIKQWLYRLYTVIYVFSITVIVWRLVDTLVEWYQIEVEPKKSDSHQADTILLLLHRFARVLLITIAAIMLLSLYNINVNALIAALGIGGLAVSLAAQDTLSNVISGIMIMLDQPFRVGDRIEIQRLGTWGDVVDIGLRSTRIRTSDNRMVIIPNNVISTDQMVNYSYPDPRYRIQIEIGVGYGEDIEKVRQILVDTVSQVEGVISYQPVEALVVSMGEYAITMRVRWWIQSYVDTHRMFDRVYTTLRGALDEAGIEIPTGIYDINILHMPGDKNDDSQND
jgi:MscS family membrane protein